MLALCKHRVRAVADGMIGHNCLNLTPENAKMATCSGAAAADCLQNCVFTRVDVELDIKQQSMVSKHNRQQ